MTAINLLIMWLRGLVVSIAVFSLFAMLFGGMALLLHYPHYGAPLMLLVVLPLIAGALTEGD